MDSFKVGDKVVRIEFTDCFGKFQPQSMPLTVESVETVDSPYLARPYQRLYARTGHCFAEGATRFFSHCEEPTADLSDRLSDKDESLRRDDK